MKKDTRYGLTSLEHMPFRNKKYIEGYNNCAGENTAQLLYPKKELNYVRQISSYYSYNRRN